MGTKNEDGALELFRVFGQFESSRTQRLEAARYRQYFRLYCGVAEANPSKLVVVFVGGVVENLEESVHAGGDLALVFVVPE